jgi:hypothetical protein
LNFTKNRIQFVDFVMAGIILAVAYFFLSRHSLTAAYQYFKLKRKLSKYDIRLKIEW